MRTFLAELHKRDIQVRSDGGRLHCNAPAGVLTSELRDQLQQYKNEILEFLRSAEALAGQQRAIVPLQPRGNRTPVFAVGGHNGDVFCYRALAQHLGDDQPFYGLEPPGLDGHREPLTRIEDLAAYFAEQIRAFRPNGPYIVAGFCAGGMIAFELGRQLLKERSAISFLALFGAPYPTSYRHLPQLRQRLGQEVDRAVRHTRALASLSSGERPLYIAEKLRQREAAHDTTPQASPPDPAAGPAGEGGGGHDGGRTTLQPWPFCRPRELVSAVQGMAALRRRAVTLAFDGARHRGVLRTGRMQRRPHAPRAVRPCVCRALQTVSRQECNGRSAVSTLTGPQINTAGSAADAGPLIRSGGIERKRWDALDRSAYIREYLDFLEPVIVLGAIDHWPALGKWTPEFFRERYGSLEVVIDGKHWKLGELIERILRSTAEDPRPICTTS